MSQLATDNHQTGLISRPADTIEPPRISQPAQPMTVDLGSTLLSPSFWLLLLSLSSLVALWIWSKKTKKNVLARGHLADDRHKRAARQRSMKLIQKRKHNEVALWLQTPAGLRTQRLGKKWQLYVPEDPKTLYLPNVEAGMAAIGATGSGKSYSFINPAVRSALDQGFPVIYFDYKYTADDPSPTAQIAGYAKERGYTVSVFGPGLPESCVCNPLDLLRDAKDAETARQFALVLHKNFTPSNSSENNPFFTQTAQKMIQGLMMVAKYSPYADLMMCRAIARTPNLPELIEASQLPELIKIVFDSLVASGGAPETLSGIQATVSNMLGNLMSPNILPALCGRTTMPLALDGRQLLVFAVDGERRDVVLPMLATILHLTVNRNVMRARRSPLILCLDELPTIYLPSLDDWLNQNRSAGLCTIIGFQSMDMMEKLYGKTGSGRVLGGCTTQAFFQLNDLETCRRISDLLGKQDVLYQQQSQSHSRGGGNRSVSHQRSTSAVLESNEITTFPRGKAVILNRGYGTAHEARVPLVEQIVIPQNDIDAVNESVKHWPHLKQQLIDASALCLPTDNDLIRRNQAVSSLLAPPVSPTEAAAEALRRQADAAEFAHIEAELDLTELATPIPF